MKVNYSRFFLFFFFLVFFFFLNITFKIGYRRIRKKNWKYLYKLTKMWMKRNKKKPI